ncbi:S-acyltransferase [Heracleum sosnowskyi]|uniref:S-acyltransferase n=1 Tax=Heracleum sosnowskyi TaxID=360622 RepID=A0AAD8IWW9_9APIA|nr:S-acyltransferase [Heracleum sosnowskyi]
MASRVVAVDNGGGDGGGGWRRWWGYGWRLVVVGRERDPSMASRGALDPSSKTKFRRYQVWKGRNKFLCGGRLIFGPDASSVALSAFLIATPAVTFCVKMFLRISHRDPAYGYTVFFVGTVLLFLDLIFLYMTSARNPGIVPRNTSPLEVDTPSVANSVDWINGSMSLKIPRTKDVVVNGHTVRVKYCETCLLFRPPRASHCSICDNCVERFDHHCPWVGQCIGSRNYRFYIVFITSSTLLCMYVFVFSLLNLLQQPVGMWKAMSEDMVSVVLVAYCFVAVWFVGGLSLFHFYLMSTNQTTYENFRYRYDKKKNPYNQGIVSNLKEVFFTKIPPSLVNFRELVEYEDEESYRGSYSHRYDFISKPTHVKKKEEFRRKGPMTQISDREETVCTVQFV